MPNKKDYPDWFNNYSPPYFYIGPPFVEFISYKEVGRKRIFDGDKIVIDPQKEYIFEQECHYNDDRPDCYIKEVVKIVKPNKNYEKELKAYEKAKNDHEKKLEQWKNFKKKWDAEQKEEDEKRELAQLAKLKKKYES